VQCPADMPLGRCPALAAANRPAPDGPRAHTPLAANHIWALTVALLFKCCRFRTMACFVFGDEEGSHTCCEPCSSQACVHALPF